MTEYDCYLNGAFFVSTKADTAHKAAAKVLQQPRLRFCWCDNVEGNEVKVEGNIYTITDTNTFYARLDGLELMVNMDRLIGFSNGKCILIRYI